MMGTFRKLGEHKRVVAGTLAATGIAVATFFGGAWAGSSGAVTLGVTPASHATHMPGDAEESGGHSCCPMHSGEEGAGVGKHGDMHSGEMRPGMGTHGEK
ncbi:hypothetical protein ACT18_21125 [Mycolicibacter kumamotonensis]|uniref:Uncharacterized protein n=2 Tax=Mycolicibacter kumamotonensis TaxID=354243 RepID=A0A1B8SAI9_9MYCO|nr:hypothetical protein ACT18_21125 [Mycolicibacter kumamotonensis]